jgi:hypothetical protein
MTSYRIVPLGLIDANDFYSRAGSGWELKDMNNTKWIDIAIMRCTAIAMLWLRYHVVSAERSTMELLMSNAGQSLD